MHLSRVTHIQSLHLHMFIEQQNIVINGKGELLCVDFLGPFPQGFRRLRLVCTNPFTKMVKLYPVPRPTTKVVMNTIIHKHIPKNGAVTLTLSK